MNNGYRVAAARDAARALGGRRRSFADRARRAGVWLGLQLKSELSPIEDRGMFMMFAIAPEGSTMQYTDRYMYAVEEIAKTVPEIETIFAVVAPGLERPNPVNLGHRLLRAQALGGAHAQPDADHQGAHAQAVRRPARRALLHQGPALARRQLPGQEDQLRPVRQQLRGAAGQARQDHAQAGPVQGHHRPGHRPQAEQAAAQGRHRPREGGRARRVDGDDRPHARDADGRARRHALQARGQAVRRGRAGRGRQAAPALRPHLRSTCAATAASCTSSPTW